MKRVILVILFSQTVLAVGLPWETSYDCEEWEHGQGEINCQDDENALAIALNYQGTNCAAEPEAITASSNYPLGNPDSLGQRHCQGDGGGDNNGGLRVDLDAPQDELWIRWYMRYEQGYHWDGDHTPPPGLLYDKWLYINSGEPDAIIPEWNDWHGTTIACANGYRSRSWIYGWDDVMVNGTTIDGHKASDGAWHSYEIHIKMDTDGTDGLAYMWIDGNLRMSDTGADFGSTPGWFKVFFGSNQAYADNGKPMSVDFDDLKIVDETYPDFTTDDFGNQMIGSIKSGLCSDGQTTSCNTGQEGICSAGTQTCSGGSFGVCVRDNDPTTEICGNGIDEDCDGSDLMCPAVCGNAQVESGEDCDDGNIVTEECEYGLQSCIVCDSNCQNVEGATSWCEDGACDASNENCDSCEEDCGACEPTGGCPDSMPEGMIYCQDFEQDGWQDEFTGRDTWENHVARVNNNPYDGNSCLRGNQMAGLVDPITGLEGRGNTLLDWRGENGDIHIQTPHEMYFSYWFKHDDFDFPYSADNGEGKLFYFIDPNYSVRAMYIGGQLCKRDLSVRYSNGGYGDSWAYDNWGYSSIYLGNQNIEPSCDGDWRHFEYYIDYDEHYFQIWIDEQLLYPCLGSSNSRYCELYPQEASEGKIMYDSNLDIHWQGFQLFYASTSDGRNFQDCVDQSGYCVGWQLDTLEVWNRLPDSSPCTPVHNADNNPCDSVVSITELIAYINRWIDGDVSLSQVMEAIVVWKG